MRLSIDTLKRIESEFGEFDVNQIMGSNEMYLRFGYWDLVNGSKLSEILGPTIQFEIEDYYDEDCGNKYLYIIKSKF